MRVLVFAKHTALTMLILVVQIHAGWGADTSIHKVPENEALKHGLGRARIRSAHTGFDEPVLLKVIVDRQGNVESAEAFDGPRGAYLEAEIAEKGLKFAPFLEDGKPVRASFTDHVSVFPLERWSDPRKPFPPIRNWKTVMIKMERRAFCFEPRCMAYIVQISADGGVDLVQRNFASSHPGRYAGKISPEHYKELIDEFRRVDFFSMLAYYVEDLTDGQGALISFWYDGQVKTVAQYYGKLAGAPDGLTRLADRIDQLAETAEWVKDKR